MLRYAVNATGGGAAGVVNHAHGLAVTPDWSHAQSRTSTNDWRVTLSNPPHTNVNVSVMVQAAQAIHYTAYAIVWQGRSY